MAAKLYTKLPILHKQLLITNLTKKTPTRINIKLKIKNFKKLTKWFKRICKILLILLKNMLKNQLSLTVLQKKLMG